MKNNKQTKYSPTDHAFALRWAKRIRLLSILGCKCSKCGNNNIFVLDFHHIHTGKKANIGTVAREWLWSALEKELKKCVILCRNCHGEEHYGKGAKLSKDMLLNVKGQNCCSICGYGYSTACLDFHHKNDRNKKFNVSYFRFRKTTDLINDNVIKELEKCDVLCRNCHIIKHIKISKFNKLKQLIDYKIKHPKDATIKKCLREINIKGSCYRNTLARWLSLWRKTRSVTKMSRILRIKRETINCNLLMSRIYKKISEKIKGKHRYRWVNYDIDRNKWRGLVKINKQKYLTKRYVSEEDAAMASDKIYIRYCGKQDKTNFKYSDKEIKKIMRDKL